MTSAPKRFPLGLDDLVRTPASKTAKPGTKTGTQGGVSAKTNIGAKTATKATVAHAGFDSKKAAPANPSAANAKPRSVSTVGASRPTTSAPQTISRPVQPISRPVQPSPPPARPRVISQVAAAVKVAPAPPAPTPMRASTAAASPAHFSLTSERVRERMVERVRANGVSDPRVLAAMGAVPRHLFVDPGFATQAYEEAALPIGHHQTISKPSVVARMIELAANGRVLDNVLEIGTGCGYQAAVLSGMARDVYSIERIRPLYERAKQNLRPLRIPNIRLHYGDGRLGMPKVAPFDAIVIAAAGLDVPQALLEQLQIGGRLVAPVGAESQVLTLVERVAENQWHESQLDRVFFVPLKSGVI